MVCIILVVNYTKKPMQMDFVAVVAHKQVIYKANFLKKYYIIFSGD